MPAASADVINVIDVIPVGASAETGQNSEPSIGVDPLNPNVMISGAFSSTLAGNDLSSPFWMSTNAGTTWTGFGSLPSSDKTIAWRQDGVAALAATLNVVNPGSSTVPPTGTVSTFQSGMTNFGAAINTTPVQVLPDQPWIRTGPGGQTYLALNRLANFAGSPIFGNGHTASIMVSTNNGNTYGAPIALETVTPAAGQDAPSVRQAVNGNTVYAAFTRWGTPSTDPVTGNTTYSGSQVVVTKSTNSGATFSAGTVAATPTGYFSQTDNSNMTLGQEQVASDLAIAVDPNNASHVVVAYGDRTSSAGLQLKVVESTDGGATWSAPKFTTSSSVRSALPGISILANGDIGVLYASYIPGGPNPNADGTLSQHLVTTTDDFATTTDSLLGTETNTFPAGPGTLPPPPFFFDPYVGDFYDLTSVGDTLYGIFSASNDDNGNASTGAVYPDATFQRDFTGTPGTASFTLTNSPGGSAVPFSIDPLFFSFSPSAPPPPTPEPATLSLLGTALVGMAALRRRRR